MGIEDPVHDRAYLLGEAKRNDVLALCEVERYGDDSFGDRDYVSIYGLKPAEWYARGVRLLARTAVECTRDRLADLIGRDIAEVAAAAASTITASVIVDPFAGSGNTLYWIGRHASAQRRVGFELDDAVFELSRRNLSLVGLDGALVHEEHGVGLASLRIAENELLIVFVAPPWGAAFGEATGLDLRLTQPPIAGIVDLIAASFPDRAILLAVQVHELVVPDSLTEVSARCDWSREKMYDIDAPGKNHGLLLGTLGWAPRTFDS